MRKLWLTLFVQYILTWVLIKAQDSWSEQCAFAEQICPNSKITFWLYKNDTFTPMQLDPLNLVAQDFEPRLPLKILIHGFIGNRTLTPNLEVRDILLQTQSVHVISVDYGALVRFPCYFPWATQNAPQVAQCLAQMIDGLIDAGIYMPQQIHLIGFSMGAQVAGLTANYVKRPLKRITGLDPAGPGFMYNENNKKLDSSDAEFIDVIHTDPFFFSQLNPMGHVDFYPNLAKMNQPGCNYFSEWRFYNCNHFRAAMYYAESITTKRGFWAQHCGNWWNYYMQRCNQYAYEPNTQMGYFVTESARGSFFLTTHPIPPFAKGPFIDIEMDVAIGDSNQSENSFI